METRTKTRETATGINDQRISGLVERLRCGVAIHDNHGVVVGVKTRDDGSEETLMVSDWNHRILGTFKNVKFRTPQVNGKFLKFVEAGLTLLRSGEIIIIPSYWRYGVMIAGKLVTRTYRIAGQPNAKHEIRFGEEVSGKIIVREAKNSRTKETKVIVDYYIYLTPTKTTHEVKIGGKKRENTVFSASIPGTNEFVVVNKIG